MDKNTFRAWRRERYRTQVEAGQALGISRETVHAWERDKTRPISWRFVELACKGLDLERQETGQAV